MQQQMAEFARRQVAGRGLSRTDSFPHDLWRDMAQAGLFRIGLPEALGGTGGGYAAIAEGERALMAEGGCLGFGMAWTGHQMVARYFLLGFGSEAQRAFWVPALAAGISTAAVAISEPGAGAHPKHLRTTARRDGDTFVLNGEKTYVTNGPIADLFVVLAITAMEGERKRYSAFLVPHDTPGLERVPMPAYKALKPAGHCSLRLTDCAVPAASRLGAPDTAYETMAMPFRDVEDIVGASGMAGMLRYLVQRFARDGGQASPEEALSLGGLVALLSVLERNAAEAAAGLEGDGAGGKPDGAALIGGRLFAAHIADRLKEHRRVFRDAADADIDTAFADIDASFAIAKGPRSIKQARLASSFLQQDWPK